MSACPRIHHAFQTELSSPPLERKGWLAGTGPTFFTYFLWVAYFDQLGRRTLSIGGLGWSVLGAACGGLLCYLLLYRTPALWGQRTGRSSSLLCTSTFGTRGSLTLMHGLFGVAQIVIMAIATLYACDWIFQGMNLYGFINVKLLKPVSLDLGGSPARKLELRSPLILFTSLVWIFAAALTARYLVKIIAALMRVFPIFPAFMLALGVLLTAKGLPNFRPLEVDPATAQPVASGGPRAFLIMIQMIFGFFAIAGAFSADWGVVSRSERDVKLGGWVGVGLSSWTVATLSLLTVAGAAGEYAAPLELRNAPGVGHYSYRVALLLGVPVAVAGASFLVLGLASMAQACFSAHLFALRLMAIWPGVSRLAWVLISAMVAWPLVATGFAIRIEELFTLFGALFAPIAGAMTADSLRSRGRWLGPRPGFHLPGMLAWGLGSLVGLAPWIATWLGVLQADWFQPAALHAFLTSFLLYHILALVGLETQAMEIALDLPADSNGISEETRPDQLPEAQVSGSH